MREGWECGNAVGKHVGLWVGRGNRKGGGGGAGAGLCYCLFDMIAVLFGSVEHWVCQQSVSRQQRPGDPHGRNSETSGKHMCIIIQCMTKLTPTADALISAEKVIKVCEFGRYSGHPHWILVEWDGRGTHTIPQFSWFAGNGDWLQKTEFHIDAYLRDIIRSESLQTFEVCFGIIKKCSQTLITNFQYLTSISMEVS